MRVQAGRNFYTMMAAAIAAVVFLGFSRTFYLRAWFDVPPLARLYFAHGVVASAWVLLFIAQARLVATRNVAVHRRLGLVGAVLALVMVGLGLAAAIASAAVQKPHVMGLDSAQFSLIPLVELAGFAGFVAGALLLRGRPALHKRLMLLAMITAVAPAVARLVALAGLASHYLLLQAAVTAAFVGWAWYNDWRRDGKVHPVLAGWGLVLVVSWPLRMWLATTPAWEPIGRWFASLGQS